MAELRIEGDELVLELTTVEEIEGVHGTVRLPASSIRSVEVLDDAIHAVHGMRAPGTGIPGSTAVGTFRSPDEKMFAVVHHDTPRGVRVRLEGADYDELIVGCAEPEAVAASLGR